MSQAFLCKTAKSENRPSTHISGNRGDLNGSTQHHLEV
jgi:hypothetical protein